MRVKITKATKGYKQGDVVEVSRPVGIGLIAKGFAISSKDMTDVDYKTDGGDTHVKSS